jgi:hypothetical protein
LVTIGPRNVDRKLVKAAGNTWWKGAAGTLPQFPDFSNLSTLPPVYTVVSVDTSGCTSPCAISALLKNLGGMSGARAPSVVTFTVTDPASGRVAGACKVQVAPDVGYNSTTTAGCTIADLNTQQLNAATVTAAVDNPGRS